jgi:hypothetical protein
VGDVDEKALCLVKFASFLYKPPRCWRGAQVTSLFTHLRHHFFEVVAVVSFFDGDIMGKARKAVARNAEEARAHMEEVAKSCLLPLCLTMIDWARREQWAQRGWATAKDKDARVAYLALATCLDTGKRPSNVTGPTKKKGKITCDHGALARHLEVLTPGVGGRPPELLHGGPGLQQWLADLPDPAEGESRYASVDSIKIRFVSDKTTTDGAVGREAVYFGRRLPRESQYIDDMLDWMRLSVHLTANDYLFTRFQPAAKAGSLPRRRLMRRQDIATLAKSCAVAHNLDPKRFSASSARKGYATTAAAHGVADSEAFSRGGWASGSKTVDNHYRRVVGGRGAFALSGDKFGLVEVSSFALVAQAQISGAVSDGDPRDDGEGESAVTLCTETEGFEDVISEVAAVPANLDLCRSENLMFILGGTGEEDGDGPDDSRDDEGGSDSGRSATSDAEGYLPGKEAGVCDSGSSVPVRAPSHSGSEATPAAGWTAAVAARPTVRASSRRL